MSWTPLPSIWKTAGCCFACSSSLNRRTFRVLSGIFPSPPSTRRTSAQEAIDDSRSLAAAASSDIPQPAAKRRLSASSRRRVPAVPMPKVYPAQIGFQNYCGSTIRTARTPIQCGTPPSLGDPASTAPPGHRAVVSTHLGGMRTLAFALRRCREGRRLHRRRLHRPGGCACGSSRDSGERFVLRSRLRRVRPSPPGERCGRQRSQASPGRRRPGSLCVNGPGPSA